MVWGRPSIQHGLLGSGRTPQRVSKQKASILFVDPSDCLGHNMALTQPHAPSLDSVQRLDGTSPDTSWPCRPTHWKVSLLPFLPSGPSLASVYPSLTMGGFWVVKGVLGGGGMNGGFVVRWKNNCGQMVLLGRDPRHVHKQIGLWQRVIW